jgi:ribosomal protein L16 Arg81 hydroxylase
MSATIPPGTLQRLLGNVAVETFLGDYYLKLPFALAGAAADLVPLGNWETIEAILGANLSSCGNGTSSPPDLMVVRAGERWNGPHPTTAEQARDLVAQGCTLLVRHAERHIPELADWARGFQQELCGEVNIHLYCTPAGQFGFGWHYDVEEVFIVQTTGSKEYSLRKNTVNPWPVLETLPADMRYEREIMPLLKCRLRAGDWLYIPAGYWHRACAEEEAISLAIGVMAPTGLDVLEHVRREALSSLLWRQRLPVVAIDTPAECPPDDPLRRHLEDLAADLARRLSNWAPPRDWGKDRQGG